MVLGAPESALGGRHHSGVFSACGWPIVDPVTDDELQGNCGLEQLLGETERFVTADPPKSASASLSFLVSS